MHAPVKPLKLSKLLHFKAWQRCGKVKSRLLLRIRGCLCYSVRYSCLAFMFRTFRLKKIASQGSRLRVRRVEARGVCSRQNFTALSPREPECKSIDSFHPHRLRYATPTIPSIVVAVVVVAVVVVVVVVVVIVVLPSRGLPLRLPVPTLRCPCPPFLDHREGQEKNNEQRRNNAAYTVYRKRGLRK